MYFLLCAQISKLVKSDWWLSATIKLIGNSISVPFSFAIFFFKYSLHFSSSTLFFLSCPSPLSPCFWREGIKRKVTQKEREEIALWFCSTIPFSTFESQYGPIIKWFKIKITKAGLLSIKVKIKIARDKSILLFKKWNHQKQLQLWLGDSIHFLIPFLLPYWSMLIFILKVEFLLKNPLFL